MLARGSRPPCLGEPRGLQEQDQQRTVEQTAWFTVGTAAREMEEGHSLSWWLRPDGRYVRLADLEGFRDA